MTFEEKEEIMSNPKIWVDFHNADQYGNVRLNCARTQKDLQEQNIELSNGVQLTLYDEELEVEGLVVFSEIENDWVAQVKWLDLIESRSLVVEEVKVDGSAKTFIYKDPEKKKSLFERIKNKLRGEN